MEKASREKNYDFMQHRFRNPVGKGKQSSLRNQQETKLTNYEQTTKHDGRGAASPPSTENHNCAPKEIKRVLAFAAGSFFLIHRARAHLLGAFGDGSRA